MKVFLSPNIYTFFLWQIDYLFNYFNDRLNRVFIVHYKAIIVLIINFGLVKSTYLLCFRHFHRLKFIHVILIQILKISKWIFLNFIDLLFFNDLIFNFIVLLFFYDLIINFIDLLFFYDWIFNFIDISSFFKWSNDFLVIRNAYTFAKKIWRHQWIIMNRKQLTRLPLRD